MSIARLSSLLIACVLFVAFTNSGQAQTRRVQIQPSQRSYDVTIVSEYGIPVRVGIFGYSTKATFRLTFDGGRTGPDVYEQELIGGDRVVIVWDTKGNRLMVADLTVDSDGTLVLGPLLYGAARGAAPKAGKAKGAAAMKRDLPKLKIKPKR